LVNKSTFSGPFRPLHFHSSAVNFDAFTNLKPHHLYRRTFLFFLFFDAHFLLMRRNIDFLFFFYSAIFAHQSSPLFFPRLTRTVHFFFLAIVTFPPPFHDANVFFFPPVPSLCNLSPLFCCCCSMQSSLLCSGPLVRAFFL